MKKLLVIGCGRSGTKSISNILNQCGLSGFLHESDAGSDGQSNWYETARSIDDLKNEYEHIFHQIRNPVDVISSVQTLLPRSWNYICENVEDISMNDPILVRGMKYWLRWNMMASRKSEYFYRIEDISSAIFEIISRIGIGRMIDVHDIKIQKMNHRRHSMFSWSDLMNADEKNMHTMHGSCQVIWI
jgi:hypothetical protein